MEKKHAKPGSILTGHRKKSMNNHAFSDRYVYTGTYKTPTSIHLISYDKDHVDSKKIPTDSKSFRTYCDPERINWFNIVGLTDDDAINRMLAEFGFDVIDGKDVLTPHHVVKVDDYADHVIIVMGSCFLQEQPRGIKSEHVCILAKKNLVLTFSEKDDSLFRYVKDGLKSNTMAVRETKSGMLVAFLLNAVFGQLIETALYVEEKLEVLEKRLLDTEENGPNVSPKQIQQLRHANLIIRRNTMPLREEFDKLCKDQVGIIDNSMTRVFAELGDQLEYIIQTSENSKEMLSSLEDLYMSHNDVKMNSIMKRLTVLATIFIPITFLVGLWGMNFKFMPEIDWEWGYIYSWVVILATALGTWIYMKKKKWF